MKGELWESFCNSSIARHFQKFKKKNADPGVLVGGFLLTNWLLLAHLHSFGNMALTFSEYPFLKELGLAEDNPGVYNGQWGGSGDFVTSYNPTTGKAIARCACCHVLGLTVAQSTPGNP